MVDSNFSKYVFDIVAMLNGKYEPGKISSLQALGTEEWKPLK
jgi:hypothetical protein